MIDVLLITALESEYEELRKVLVQGHSGWRPALTWSASHIGLASSVELTNLEHATGTSLKVGMTYADQMGPLQMSSLTASLATAFSPDAVLMSGVCAGHPGRTTRGDVIIATQVYSYEEGKRTENEFLPDTRPVPMHADWQVLAKELRNCTFASQRAMTLAEQVLWALEELEGGSQPTEAVAYEQCIPTTGDWDAVVNELTRQGLGALRPDGDLRLTAAGGRYIKKAHRGTARFITSRPFLLHRGPIASGSAVVKDGTTFKTLERSGVRSIVGLEMEAAAVGTAATVARVPRWAVIKGVMDYASMAKDDRYKPFASRASAEVLMEFLRLAYVAQPGSSGPGPGAGPGARPTLSASHWSSYRGSAQAAASQWEIIATVASVPAHLWPRGGRVPLVSDEGPVDVDFLPMRQRLSAITTEQDMDLRAHEAVLAGLVADVQALRQAYAARLYELAPIGVPTQPAREPFGDQHVDVADEADQRRLQGLLDLLDDFAALNLVGMQSLFAALKSNAAAPPD